VVLTLKLLPSMLRMNLKNESIQMVLTPVIKKNRLKK